MNAAPFTERPFSLALAGAATIAAIAITGFAGAGSAITFLAIAIGISAVFAGGWRFRCFHFF